MIGERFEREIDQSDLEDESFIRWVNDKLSKSVTPSNTDYSSIGKNYSIDMANDQEGDPFAGLKPGR